ncbi:MAG: hypothetical protein J3K34DRAFT_464703 [Monoraphidium minutum]|nr:MAG: hypothetical protein J3K34DRAFT_464703 [Monoraphidium minutum]
MAAAGPVVAKTCPGLWDKLRGGFDNGGYWADFGSNNDAAAGALQRFQKAVTIPTVSQAVYTNSCSASDAGMFQNFKAFVRANYEIAKPGASPDVSFDDVGGCSLSFMITWKGKDPALKPAAISGHYDVVPTDPAKLADWKCFGANGDKPTDPFAGKLLRSKDVICGRRAFGGGPLGTADDKGHIMANLETADLLFKEGWRPRRTLLLIFNHDEEAAGLYGGAVINQLIKDKYGELVAIWEEGVGVLRNLQTQKVTAMIAVAEKGQQFINLTVKAAGGHSSSTPTDGSAMGDILSRILPALQNTRKDPSKFDSAPAYVTNLVKRIGKRKVMERADMIFNLLLGVPAKESWVYTKKALTLMQTGSSENTLPQVARITYNFRTLEGAIELYGWNKDKIM